MLFIDKNKITDLAPLVAVCKADADGKKNFAGFVRDGQLQVRRRPESFGSIDQRLAEEPERRIPGTLDVGEDGPLEVVVGFAVTQMEEIARQDASPSRRS